MHIVMASEYGKGLGRLSRLLMLAMRLKQDGHHVTIIHHDLHILNQFPDLIYNLDIVAAPTRAYGQHVLGGAKVKVASYLDKLAILGFSQSDTLGYFVASYLSLLRHNQPDVIIADAAPVLQFYGYAYNIPVIEMGDAFDIPCLINNSFPTYVPSKPLMTLDQLAHNMNHVLNNVSALNPLNLNDYFFNHPQFIIHHKDLDPLQAYRQQAHYHRFNALTDHKPKAFVAESNIFVYLSAQTPNLDRLFAAFQRLKLVGHIYMPYAKSAHQQFLQSIGFTVHTACPENALELMIAAKMVIHIGGPFITDFCLTHKLPQFIIPLSIKSINYARRIKALDIGDYSDFSGLNINQIEGILRQFLSNSFTGILSSAGSEISAQAISPTCLIDLLPAIINKRDF